MKTLKEILESRWTRQNGEIDQHMVDYCLKSSTYLEINGYYLDLLHKPSINSTIYYADQEYGTHKMAKDPGTGWNVFHNYNIRLNSPKHWIETIESGEQEVTIHDQYENSEGLKGWTTKRWSEEPRNNGRVATEEEKQVILEGLKIELEKYEKRLKTYFKRYSSKISTSSYWAER